MKLQAIFAVVFFAAMFVVAFVLMAKGCQNDGPSPAVLHSAQWVEKPFTAGQS